MYAKNRTKVTIYERTFFQGMGVNKVNSEIIIALFSLIGTAMGTFGGVKLTNYRIEQLEKKVDKHNNLVERTAVIENTLKVQDHRIADLENLAIPKERSECKFESKIN